MRYTAVVFALAGSAVAVANPDGAPPAHTGAFGEPSCHACHFDGPERAPGGPVRIVGLPERIVPGEAYELVVTLEAASPGAGLQLAVRDSDGRQAGTLASADGTTRVVEHDGIQYLGHVDATARRWKFSWRAPDAPLTLVFAGAVNAVNDDQSEFGDEIYLLRALMEMERE